MAFTRVNPGDPIHASQLDQVIDALDGASGAGQPIALTALNDASNYALTVQNDDPTNSRALNVLSSSGTTLIKADVTGVTLGSPLNLPTGSVTSAAIANAGVANVDLGPDVARANLLTNGGFEIWQRGPGPFTANAAYSADRWQASLTGTDAYSLSKDTTNVDTGSSGCAALTFTLGTGGGNSNIQQLFRGTDYTSLAGQTLSFSIRVKTSTANAIRAAMTSDGTGNSVVTSSFHTGSGTYQTLTVTYTVPTNATYVVMYVALVVSHTSYLDNACLVVGSQPANYVPLHPADDVARCLRYFEQSIPSDSAEIFAGTPGAGASYYNRVPFKVIKATTPTITKSGTWTVSNSGQPSSGSAGVNCWMIAATATAAGYAFVQANAATSVWIAEANP